jgi:prepilin signal peptidase PulO-like enzyme (type II secretory pathway)
MIGAFLGPGAVIFITFLSSFIGSGLALSKVLFKGAKFHSGIPFGPSIALACLLYIFCFNWFMGLLNTYLTAVGS